MKIGYARVSTDDQELGRQLTALTEAGCSIIFQEKITGSTVKRPELQKMLDSLKAGDVVTVQKLDRLGRSISDLINLIKWFHEVKVGFVSLGDQFDTTTPAGKLCFHMLAAFAEFERDIIRQRTKDGLAEVRRKGKRLGRPEMEAQTIAEILTLAKNETSIAEIARRTKLSRTTVYKVINAN